MSTYHTYKASFPFTPARLEVAKAIVQTFKDVECWPDTTKYITFLTASGALHAVICTCMEEAEERSEA